MPIEDYIKSLASVIFKNYMAIEEPTPIWNNIDPPTQDTIKYNLLLALKNEINPKVTKVLCQAVGELGAMILDDEKEWADLNTFIHNYIFS